MVFADSSIALLTVVLVILFHMDSAQIWHIYLIMLGRGIGETFHFPAFAASIPMIVEEKQLVRANGLLQMLQNAINVVAPVAGAFLMETLPVQGVLAVDIITAAIAIGCLIPSMIPRPSLATFSAKTNYLVDMKQGLHYIWSRRGLVILIIIVSLLVFFVTPASSLMPVLVNEHLDGEVVKLGWLGSANGIGGISGGLLLGVWGGLKKRMLTAFFGFLIMIPCSVLVGFTTPGTFYFISLPAMLLMGAGLSLVNASLGAILNSVVAKDVQGRVFSIYVSLIMAMTPLGLIIGGPLADALGIRSLWWIAAGAWLIIIISAMFSKSLLNLEGNPAEETYENITVVY
jgi:DHA3 family macrolide efflux protein-like MFS transporter